MQTATAIKITAKDLRISNWVRTLTAYDAPREIQVHSIEATTINGTIPFDDLEGIELTGKTLLAWGFEKDNIDNMDGFTLKGRLSIFLEPVQCEDGRIVWFTYIEFNVAMGFNHLVINPPRDIHSLQNLIYDLTGTEL